MTCDFQQCSILTRIDSDEPWQSPDRLRNSGLTLPLVMISHYTIIYSHLQLKM